MKTTKIKGVALLNDADISKLDAKFVSRLTGNSLCKGMDYKIIGFAKVDASKTNDGRDIPEWVGVLLVDRNGKELVAGINTILGVSLTGSKELGFTNHYTTARFFNNISELKNSFNTCMKVIGFEGLESQIFDSEKTRVKDHPIMERSNASISYIEGAEIVKEPKVPKEPKAPKEPKVVAEKIN